jgi:hypothetical protein
MKTRISFTANDQYERAELAGLLRIANNGNGHKNALEHLDVWLKYAAKSDTLHTPQEVRDKLWELLKNEDVTLHGEGV